MSIEVREDFRRNLNQLWKKTSCLQLITVSHLNQRPWQARSGAVQEDPHAQGLGAFCSHQTHLPADVIDVVEPVQLRLVVRGIPFQARDSLFNRLAEPRADLEAFLGGAIGDHGWHLGAGMLESADLCGRGLKFFSLVPILTKAERIRQITVSRNSGNEVSENRTGFRDQVSASIFNAKTRHRDSPMSASETCDELFSEISSKT
jgi:hypothetical protein